MKVVRKPLSEPPPGSWQPDRPADLRDTWPDIRLRVTRSGLHRFKDAVLKLIGATR